MLWAAGASAATSPASAVVRVYEVRLSTSSDCSGGITFMRKDRAAGVDLISSPVLLDSVAKGEYRCVALHLSDVMVVTPKADDGERCRAGKAFTQDVFHSRAKGDVSVDLSSGAVIRGTGTPFAPSEDGPWAYFSDSSDALPTNNCWQPRKGPGIIGPCVLKALGDGGVLRSLMVDFSGTIETWRGDGRSHCIMHHPLISIERPRGPES